MKNLLGQLSSSCYYLHINKTGGSSFSAVIRRSFPEFLVCPAGLAKELIAIPSKKLLTYKYYSGHFGLGLPLMLPLVKRLRLRTFTVLRDPVDRSLSQLNAYFRNKGTYFHDLVSSVECDVEKCLQNERILSALSNYQSKCLAIPVRFDKFSLIQQCGGNFQELLVRASSGFTEDELFGRASRSLQGFCFVGLTEKMEESSERLSRVLGLPSFDVVPRVNVSAVNPYTGLVNSLNRGHVSAAVIRKLEEINRADLRLYDHVVRGW